MTHQFKSNLVYHLSPEEQLRQQHAHALRLAEQQGWEKGCLDTQLKMAQKMLMVGASSHFIMDITGLTKRALAAFVEEKSQMP
ncbi:TPA: hypothetical protein ACGTRQ_003791 [Vibrio parahaemolyticus]